MGNARDIYPVTIIRSRYGGVYEGGQWAALDCSHGEVPDAAIGDDVECAEFWALARVGRHEISDWRARGRCRVLNVGAGSTLDAALASLVEARSVR